MKVYLLKRPDKFTGFFGGVDWYQGIGSTAHEGDAKNLVANFGCKVVEPEEQTRGGAAADAAPAVLPKRGRRPKQ